MEEQELAETNDGGKQRGEEPVKNGPQIIASISVTLLIFASGSVMGWTSPTLPLLTAENSTLPVTPDQEAWIGSLMPMSAVVGPFFGGAAADAIGRKPSLLAVGIMILVSWGILAVAQSVWYLYVGRLLAGFALGWGMTVQPMYIGEIATANIRGALNSFVQIQICLGFLYVYSLGPYVSYIWLCILCGITAVLFFGTFLFMPESPLYLVLKDDVKGATKALMWLRGQSAAGVKKELNIIQVEIEHLLQNKGTWSETFMNYGNRKAILIVVFLMILQQLTGVTAVLFYSQQIFDQAGSGLSSSSSTIVVGVVMLLASFLVPFLVETYGRIFSMVLSSLLMTIALTALGAYFYLDYIKTDVSGLSWLPLAAILIFIGTQSFGIGPVPWLIMSEIFAPNIRANGSAISSSSSWLAAFVVTNMFTPVMTTLGAHTTFWLFAAISIIGAVLIYFFIPETKGKTLQEIQVMLNEK